MKRAAVLTSAGALLLAFAGGLWYSDRQDGAQTPPSISVLAYSNSGTGRWRALDQGIQQACAELGMEKPVITQTRKTGAAQFDDLLNRALANDAQGLLILAGEPAAVQSLDRLAPSVPVVLLREDVTEEYPSIGGDNASMGQALADYMAGQSSEAAVLEMGLEQADVAQRYRAFRERMAELGCSVTVIPCDPNAEDLKAYLASTFATHTPPIKLLAAMDNDTLETAAEALPASMVEIALCGVGSSDKLVHALDSSIVHCLVFQDEYATGYMGTMLLAEKMGIIHDYSPAAVQYRLVTRDTMYLEENESLLFPMIQ